MLIDQGIRIAATTTRPLQVTRFASVCSSTGSTIPRNAAIVLARKPPG